VPPTSAAVLGLWSGPVCDGTRVGGQTTGGEEEQENQ
jgi:hypothetical protein